jgi:hypothetical protein
VTNSSPFDAIGADENQFLETGAQALSGNSCLNDYDFRYRGVLRILHGFPLSSGSSGYSTPRSNHSSNHMSRPNSSRSHRRPDDSYLKTAAFDAACSQLVVRRKLEHVFAISSSSFKDQRKLALQVCGMEWELPVDVVCSELVPFIHSRISASTLTFTSVANTASRSQEITKPLRSTRSSRVS